jgi:predicted nucleotidyltransferase
MHKLKGNNRIRKHKQIARALTTRIAQHRGVTGILYMGGLARGFADRHSDIDMIALLADKDETLRRKLRQLGSDEQKRTGIDIDLEIHYFDDLKDWKWTELRRWDFSHAEIAFDPEGRVKQFFKEKLAVSKAFWLKRVVVLGEYLKWYCCPPKEGEGTMTEAWLDRGDMLSAHYCLNYSIDLMIRIAFALNREFVPPQKWRIHYSYGLAWLPQDYETLLKEATTIKSLAKRDLQRRLEAARKIWSGVLPKIREETGLTPATISRLYGEKVLRQS